MFGGDGDKRDLRRRKQHTKVRGEDMGKALNSSPKDNFGRE